jgi:hypothetical protein
MPALTESRVEGMGRPSARSHREHLVPPVDREDGLHLGHLEELVLLRGGGVGQGDQDAVPVGEGQEERDRVGGEVRFYCSDRAGSEPFALEPRAPLVESVEQPAVAHGRVAPDEGVL